MSSGQAPKRRSSSVIENSKYAPVPPVDDRRRKLDSLGQDRAAIERAKQEMADIARQQGGRARAAMQLDDLEVQQRKPLRMVVGSAPLPAPISGADASPQSVADATPNPEPQPPALIQPPVVAAPKKAHANIPARASRAMFEHVEHYSAHPAAPARPMHTAQTAAYARDERYDSHDVSPYWETPISLVRSQPLVLLLLVALVCGPLIWMLSQSPKTFISSYNGAGFGNTVGNVVNTILGGEGPASVFSTVNVPAGEHSVVGQPSIDAATIDTILSKYGSPAAGTGSVWVEFGQQYGIDPAYAVAFFIHESSAGSNPGWAGNKPDGSTTHNVGNIICAGYPTCYNRFRDYASWDEGIADWYRLISDEYVSGRGAASVEQIIPIYAPSFENDVDTYVQTVVMLVDGWRRQGVAR
jgi:hypothetical protein